MASWCPQILIVENDPLLRTVLKALLDFEGYRIEEAADGVEAVGKLKTGIYQVVVTDYHLPRINGLQLLRYVRDHRPTTPVILHSAEQMDGIAVRHGAYAWVQKPSVRKLVRTVRHAVAGTRPMRAGERG